MSPLPGDIEGLSYFTKSAGIEQSLYLRKLTTAFILQKKYLKVKNHLTFHMLLSIIMITVMITIIVKAKDKTWSLYESRKIFKTKRSY